MVCSSGCWSKLSRSLHAFRTGAALAGTMQLESGSTGNLPHGMEGNSSAPKGAHVARFWRAGSPPARASCPCHPWFELKRAGALPLAKSVVGLGVVGDRPRIIKGEVG